MCGVPPDLSSRFPPPPSGTVRVWVARLDRPPLPADVLRASLAPDESARLERLTFADVRARWIAGRGLLRHVLGDALGIAPSAVSFASGPNGRPVLASASPIAFNVSHARDLLAIAVARVTGEAREALALGVDVELLREVHQMAAVAQRVFDDAERAAIASHASEDARRHAFFRLWTRKEACMKATGAGFTLPPHTFHVDADAPVQRVTLPPHACAADGIALTVHDVREHAALAAVLDPGEQAVGAVAVGDPAWTVEVCSP